MSILREGLFCLVVVSWCVAIQETLQIRIDRSNQTRRHPAGSKIFQQRGGAVLAGSDESNGSASGGDAADRAERMGKA